MSNPTDNSIVPELVGLTNIIPSLQHDDVMRLAMGNKMISSSVTTHNPDRRLNSTGIEYQLLEGTYKKIIEQDSRIVNIKLKGTVANFEEYEIVYQEVGSGKYGNIVITPYEMLSPHFGFRVRLMVDIADYCKGDIIPGGTILALPSGVLDDGYVTFGHTLNVLKTTLGEGAEDAASISRSASERMSFSVYDTYDVYFGFDKVPCILSGPDEPIRVLPKVGELLNDNLVMAVRSIKNRGMLKYSSLRDIDPDYDKCVYSKRKNPVVVKVEVFKLQPTKVNEQFGSLYKELEVMSRQTTLDMNDKIETYQEIKKYHRGKLQLTDEYNDMIQQAYKHSGKVKAFYTKKLKRLSQWYVRITTETVMTVNEGLKITGFHGNKSIVCNIVEDADMPEGVDVILELPTGVSRLNPGQDFEGTFGNASKVCKRLVAEVYDRGKGDINKAFDILLGFHKIMNKVAFESLSTITDVEEKRLVVVDVIDTEAYFITTPHGDRTHPEIHNMLNNSVYKHVPKKLMMGDKLSIKPLTILPMHFMVLDKIGDDGMATSGPIVNYIGNNTAFGGDSRSRYPFTDKAVRIAGETEVGAFAANYTRDGFRRMMGRAQNIDRKKRVYRAQLEADIPSNIHTIGDEDMSTHSPITTMISGLFKTLNFDFKSVSKEEVK